MNLVLKLMNSVLKVMNFVLKMMNFALKMMNLQRNVRGWLDQTDASSAAALLQVSCTTNL